MLEFVAHLKTEFARVADADRAKTMAAYMRNKFAFYGIGAVQRKELLQPFIAKQYLPDKETALKIVLELWEEPQRELQYCALELLRKYKSKLALQDIGLLEFLIVNKSWWDTVDFIAPQLLGPVLLKNPDVQKSISEEWMKSENLWLMRAAILFQLKYKEKTNDKLLAEIIEQQIGSTEFFINKAIGWALREYAKTNAKWVEQFVENHLLLSGLSRREALKHFNLHN